MDDIKQKAWQRRCDQLETLGVDAYKPEVLPDDPRHAQVQNILREYDIAVGRTIPVPDAWEGRPPDWPIAEMIGLAKWLEDQWRQVRMTEMGGGKFGGMALEQAALAVRNAWRVIVWIGVEKRPKRPTPAVTLAEAQGQINALERWARAKHAEGWRPVPRLNEEGAAAAVVQEVAPVAEGVAERRKAVDLQGPEKPPLVRGEQPC